MTTLAPLLVVLADLSDRPANRSALTFAAWAASQGLITSVLTREGGPLAEQAEALGPVVDAGSVNSFGPAVAAGRVGLAPVGRALKGRRLRSLVQELGDATGVFVAEPSALDLIDWLPDALRRVATVVTSTDLPLTAGAKQALSGCDVLVADEAAAGEVVGLGPAVVAAGLQVVLPPAARPTTPTVAVAGLAGNELDRFIEIARAVRRVVPAASIGWVRSHGDEERWAWPLYGRGDLVDIAGVVTSLPADGSAPVSAVVQTGPRHPLVVTAAAVVGRPIIEFGRETGVDTMSTAGGGPLAALGDGVDSAAAVPETVLDGHDVTRVGPRILAALDGR